MNGLGNSIAIILVGISLLIHLVNLANVTHELVDKWRNNPKNFAGGRKSISVERL
jgi:hypothetical protein